MAKILPFILHQNDLVKIDENVLEESGNLNFLQKKMTLILLPFYLRSKIHMDYKIGNKIENTEMVHYV